MNTSESDIVLICGAWHPPAAYDQLRELLQSKGHTVHIPRLTTLSGSQSPNADLYTDSENAANFVTELADAGRSVVLLMRSYGGQVGTNALAGLSFESRKQQNLPGGVTRLIYIGGAANLESVSMMDVVNTMGDKELVPFVFDFAEDNTYVLRDQALMVGPGLSDEGLQNYLGLLERFNGKALYQPLKHCSWREIPTSYIFTTNDMTVPMPYQEHMVGGMESAGREIQKFTLEAAHCPNITVPKELAKIVGQITA